MSLNIDRHAPIKRIWSTICNITTLLRSPAECSNPFDTGPSAHRNCLLFLRIHCVLTRTLVAQPPDPGPLLGRLAFLTKKLKNSHPLSALCACVTRHLHNRTSGSLDLASLDRGDAAVDCTIDPLCVQFLHRGPGNALSCARISWVDLDSFWKHLHPFALPSIESTLSHLPSWTATPITPTIVHQSSGAGRGYKVCRDPGCRLPRPRAANIEFPVDRLLKAFNSTLPTTLYVSRPLWLPLAIDRD